MLKLASNGGGQTGVHSVVGGANEVELLFSALCQRFIFAYADFRESLSSPYKFFFAIVFFANS